jgi:hypothetical protein
MKHTKMIRDLFVGLILLIVFALTIVLMSSQLYKNNLKLRIENNELKYSNKTLLDSLQRTINCFEYKQYLVKKECDITLPDDLNPSYLDTIDYYIKQYNLPKRIVYRLIWKESNFDSTSYNRSSNAIGLMQITLPWWYTYRGDDTDYNEYNRIKCALRGLSELYNKIGRWDLVLSTYNSGSYDKKNKIVSQNKETISFVKFILK